MRQHLLHKLPLVESHNVILFSYRLERLYHKTALLVKENRSAAIIPLLPRMGVIIFKEGIAYAQH